MSHNRRSVRDVALYAYIISSPSSTPRNQARDFDPHSLRKTLPSAVAVVRHALVQPNTK